MMDEKNNDNVRQLEDEVEEIVHIIVVDQGFYEHRKRITKFIEDNLAICNNLISGKKPKTCLFILIKLYTVCVEILRGIPRELDKDKLLTSFFTKLKLKDKSSSIIYKQNAIEFDAYLQLLRSFHKLEDITKLKDSRFFTYLLIVEHFLVIINNLAYINLKRNKFEVTIDYLMRAMELIRILPNASYFLKYHLSTVILNLVYPIEENHREEVSQLLCNLAVYLEKIESELDSHPQGHKIYKYLNEKSENFALSLEMTDQVYGQTNYKNKKSFFVSRCCMVMAYYADMLNELQQKNDANIARQHTKSLEQKLIMLEKAAESGEDGFSTAKDVLSKQYNSNRPGSRGHVDNDDKISQASFKTAQTGFTGTTHKDEQGNVISKENIIFQKYVEVNGVKFKIIIMNMKELQSIQILVYSKPRNMLRKIYVHFQDVLEYSKEHNIGTESDNGNKILTKIAKLLYFKENELLMRDIRFFTNLEELKIHALEFERQIRH